MAKKNNIPPTEDAALMEGAAAGAEGAGEEALTPNRDAYSQMWGEDNSDIDFEDKEARYGRAIDDRNELRERRKSDASLGGLFDTHEWLGAMFMELKDNPDMSPFEWLAGFCEEQGISLQEVMDDPEARERLTKKQSEYQAKQAKSKESQKQKDDNLQASLDALEQYQKDSGISDEDALQMWEDFWGMIDRAQNGEVDADTWKAFANSRSYDADIEAARNEGGMKARNEKIQNRVRKPSESQGMPPTLTQGNGTPQKKKVAPKKESFLSGLNG